MLLRLFFILSALFFGWANTWAQRPGGSGGKPAIGIVQGSLVDEQSGTPIAFAALSLMNLRDSTITTGQLADENGAFLLTEIPLGRYQLQANFMGYESWTSSSIALSPKASIQYDAGVIQLKPRINNLNEAVVAEQASSLELLIDRRVFHVGSDLSSAGGTASELLVNVPSVAVDIDGNISLRGSPNVQILIDGRPSGMAGASQNAFLEQIPASSIDRVEVITNPSAKYDPDGMAGILNIILKKNKLEGFHGQAQTTPGTGGNYNASLSLNYKSEKFSFFSNGSWNQRDQFSTGITDRIFDAGDSTSTLNQIRDGNRLRESLGGKVGVEWYPSPAEVVSISANFNENDSERIDSLGNLETWNSGYATHTQRHSSNYGQGIGWDLDGNYRKEFGGNPAHFIRAMIRHSQSESSDDSYIQESLVGEGSTIILDTNLQENFNTRTVAQIDFEKPLRDDGKLEWGWKSNLSEKRNEYTYLTPDSSFWTNGLYVPINPVSDGYSFTYREAVHAIYGTFGRKIGVWGVQGGLRLEQVYTEALLDGSAPFENDYFSVYPSFNLSKQRNDEVSWIGSYSRRVNRPRGRQVSPFIDDSDNRNIRKGNPELRPEYTHSMEFGHQWSRNRKSITTSLFLKRTHDVIRRFSTVDENGISTSSYQNLDQRQDEGLEVIAMSSLGKGGSIRFTGSLYHLSNDVGDADFAYDSQGWSYNLNLFANQTVGQQKDWKWQVNGMYRGPSVTAQGSFNGYAFMDASIQRTFLDGDLDLTLKLSDVFNTREWSYTSELETLTRTALHKRESQNLFLTITWNLGKLESGKTRGKRSDGGSGSQGSDGMDF